MNERIKALDLQIEQQSMERCAETLFFDYLRQHRLTASHSDMPAILIQQRCLMKIDQIGNFFVGMKPLDAAPIEINYEQIKTLQEKMAVFAGTRRFVFL